MTDRELSLSEIQQESLKVLIKFDEICEQNDFKYFLAYGTLIGAVRHNGFIPWDDDIDVMMPREDFNKFVQYALKNEEILKPLKLHNRENTKNYWYGIPRFSNMKYKYIVDDDYEESFDIGVFIDIYPLDNFKSYDQAKKLYHECAAINRQYGRYINRRSPGGAARNVAKFFLHYYTRLKKGGHYNQRVDDEILECIQKYSSDNDEYIGVPSWDPAMVLYERARVNDLKTERYSFEGHMLNIPTAYDYILKCNYGDYMQLPPESERHPTHNYKVILR